MPGKCAAKAINYYIYATGCVRDDYSYQLQRL